VHQLILTLEPCSSSAPRGLARSLELFINPPESLPVLRGGSTGPTRCGTPLAVEPGIKNLKILLRRHHHSRGTRPRTRECRKLSV
jgi:hypothetical protein